LLGDPQAADLTIASLLGWGCWIAAAVITVATLKLSRNRALVLVGWMLGFAGLGPAFNLVPQLAPMADHYLQWALPGFLFVMVLTGDEILSRVPALRPSIAGAQIATVVGITLTFAFLAVLRNVEFQSKKALFAATITNQPDSGLGWAGYAMRLTAEHDPNAGYAAAHALECPDQFRILNEDRYTLVKEALATFEAKKNFQRAEALLAAQMPLIDERYARLIRAEAAVRAGHAEEALQMLEAPGQSILTAMEKVRAECRAGTKLPDELPMQLRAADGKIQGAEMDFATEELLVSPLLIRAFGYWTLVQSKTTEAASENLEKAFDQAALAVNLAPERAGPRVLLAMIYERLQLPKAAQALSAKKAH
jgi:hypothetical protein